MLGCACGQSSASPLLRSRCSPVGPPFWRNGTRVARYFRSPPTPVPLVAPGLTRAAMDAVAANQDLDLVNSLRPFGQFGNGETRKQRRDQGVDIGHPQWPDRRDGRAIACLIRKAPDIALGPVRTAKTVMSGEVLW